MDFEQPIQPTLLQRVKNLDWKIQLAVVVVILVASWYIYTTYFSGKCEGVQGDVGMPQSLESGADKKLVCTMYYVDWCGYCKKAKPEWAKLEQEMNGAQIGAHKIFITSVNCEEEPAAAEEAGIQQYPTFKIKLENGETVEYKDEATFDKMAAFISAVANSA
jgi:thiol-disulfide isomerase/thioredoxin